MACLLCRNPTIKDISRPSTALFMTPFCQLLCFLQPTFVRQGFKLSTPRLKGLPAQEKGIPLPLCWRLRKRNISDCHPWKDTQGQHSYVQTVSFSKTSKYICRVWRHLIWFDVLLSDRFWVYRLDLDLWQKHNPSWSRKLHCGNIMFNYLKVGQ